MTFKRAFRWIAAILATLLLLIIVAVAVLLRSARFHDYALSTAERMATEKIGAPVTVQNFVLHPSTIGLDLYGLRVLGANGPDFPPLLQADHIGLGNPDHFRLAARAASGPFGARPSRRLSHGGRARQLQHSHAEINRRREH